MRFDLGGLLQYMALLGMAIAYLGLAYLAIRKVRK